MSLISPTRVELSLGGGVICSMALPEPTSFDTDESYTFEVHWDGRTYRACGCRVAFYDAATGAARMYPELVMV